MQWSLTEYRADAGKLPVAAVPRGRVERPVQLRQPQQRLLEFAARIAARRRPRLGIEQDSPDHGAEIAAHPDAIVVEDVGDTTHIAR